MLQLTTLHHVPAELLVCHARDLASLLPGPTLIHLRGRQPQPLFVSVLLHGNETTGFNALREVLRRHAHGTLPRALSILIGNVAAAAHNARTLPGQIDYNRVWPGTPMADCAEAHLMREVFDAIALRRPFASIDLHSNSGTNPYYGCVARLEPAYLHLARLFSRIVVHIGRPLGVQSIAMAALCPAVTVECGHIGSDDGLPRAVEFIEDCLHLSHFPEHPIAAHDIELLHTVAVVKVPPSVSISFDDSAADIRFRSDLDRLNFGPAAAGTVFGKTTNGSARLHVTPGDDTDEQALWFEYRAGELRLIRAAIPAMLTRDEQAVRADCLCYLMQPLAVRSR